MNHYPKVERTLRSLARSTHRTISLAGETVTFDGLQSPYKSHQTVTVTDGHGIGLLATIANTSAAWIAITPIVGGPVIKGDVTSVPLPSYHLHPLFQFPASAPNWVRGIVNVHVPDLFRGFAEDGSPLFFEEGRIMAESKGYEVPLDIPIWENLLPEIGRIGDVSIHWDGETLGLGSDPDSGRYRVGDLLSEDDARWYHYAGTAAELDRLLSDKAGLVLRCTGPDDCDGRCKHCPYNLRIRLEREEVVS